MQVDASPCKFWNLHRLASRLATDLHGLASYLNVFFMQVDASLSPFGHPTQVDASFSAVIETFQPIKCPNFPGNDGVLSNRHRSWSPAYTREKSWNQIRWVPAKRREQSEEELHKKKRHWRQCRKQQKTKVETLKKQRVLKAKCLSTG